MDPREQQIPQPHQGVDPALLQPRGEDNDPVPVDYSCAIMVGSLTAVTETKFADGRSAIVMPRQLTGDFNGLARQMSRDAAHGLLKNPKLDNQPYLFIDAVRAYAQAAQEFKPELDTILADMDHLLSIGRSPTLRVYTYDYSDDTVDRPHIDPSMPNLYKEGEYFPDRYICVFNNKVTRHVSHDEIGTETTPFGSKVKTFNLKPGAQAKRFNNGDIWRQACGIHPSAKGFVHWSGSEMGDGAKLILIA